MLWTNGHWYIAYASGAYTDKIAPETNIAHARICLMACIDFQDPDQPTHLHSLMGFF